MFLQEVSLKSHRSIINYPFGEFMSRKAGIVVEKCLLFQLNKDHVMGTGCPHRGHWVPNVCDCFWALYKQAVLHLCIDAK